MSSNVLDSSAVLAVLQQESGAEKAITFFSNALISSINVAEVLTKIVEKGADIETAIEAFQLLKIETVDFDLNQAAKAAELRPLTKNLGLSLGDRSCLALAILKDATAVTADKEWQKLTFCKVEVIR